MIKSERNGSLITIVIDHYTIEIDECRGIESFTLSDDRDRKEVEELKGIFSKMRQQMVSNESTNRKPIFLDFKPINDFIVEAISDYDKQFVVFSNRRNERIFVDYENPNNCKFVKRDDNGSIELRSTGELALISRYSEKKVEEEDTLILREGNRGNEPSFIKKEVFIILNDRILMYHLPFMGKVFEYMLNDDASSKQIHICVDYARIKGSILQQVYDGLTLDDKPLPVKAANECELIAKLDHVAYDYMNEVVVKGSDGKEIYIETYSQNVAFVNDPDIRIYWHAELNDVVSGEIKQFKVGRSFDHNRFIYQTAN
jgi:hypothetical protein